ncbi:hypothetical protein ACJX0J_033044 [Zea mays]
MYPLNNSYPFYNIKERKEGALLLADILKTFQIPLFSPSIILIITEQIVLLLLRLKYPLNNSYPFYNIKERKEGAHIFYAMTHVFFYTVICHLIILNEPFSFSFYR